MRSLVIEKKYLAPDAMEVLTHLHTHGFAAYLVGGCVRDLLCGRIPHDWDIATAARPEQLQTLFARKLTAKQTGKRFGTVTLRGTNTRLEVTTFRGEEAYLDHRHPQTVRFTDRITEDLKRRDFTINAMAYHPTQGLIDPYGGAADLQRGMIRCVGNAWNRLREDALRILRALRFAAVFGFSIAPDLAQAILAHSSLLKNLAMPRIYEELTKLLCGKDAGRILTDYLSILSVPIPALRPMAGFMQYSPYHCHDLLTHTSLVLSNTPPIPALRYAALLHDIAKPQTFFQDENGVGHFFGHASAGRTMAEDILRNLTSDNDTRIRAVQLIKLHDTTTLPDPVLIQKRLHRWGTDTFFQLLALQRADCLGQHPCVRNRLNTIEQVQTIARHLLTQNTCLSRASLAINGNDLLACGYRGAQIGTVLNQMLTQVMEGRVANTKEALLAALNSDKNQ